MITTTTSLTRKAILEANDDGNLIDYDGNIIDEEGNVLVYRPDFFDADDEDAEEYEDDALPDAEVPASMTVR